MMGQRGVCECVRGEAHLDDEDKNGILGVINGGVGSLKDAALIRGSDGHGDSELRWECCFNRATRWNERKEAREEKKY